MKCGACREGALCEGIVPEHDVGDLLGVGSVKVQNLPALICDKCKAITQRGEVIDALYNVLAEHIISRPELDQVEVRFLRKLLYLTQEQLAERLGVSRVTVSRWETGAEPIEGTNAYALRSLAYFNVRQNWPKIQRIERELATTAATRSTGPKRRREPYVLNGAEAA